MTNLNKIPLQDGFNTILSQEYTGGLGNINVNTVPTFTFPSGVTTYAVINPTKINQQIVEIDTYDSVNKTLHVSNITLEKGASINSTAQIHAVNSKIIISDNYQFWSDIRNAINSKIDASDGLGVIYANITARDIAIPTPTDGMQVYVISLGLFTDYIGGAWTNRATGSIANGSETVSGKFEEATQVELDSGTSVGGTGANLVVNPSKLIQSFKNGVGGIIGEIKMWPGISTPSSWVFANGVAASRTAFAELFTLIGTTYGIGDGSTTFNLPNLQNRVPVGKGTGTFSTLGAAGGAETHTLTTSEIPAHTHTYSKYPAGSQTWSAVGASDKSNTNDTTQITGTTGGGQPHSNLQPYIVMNYIIKVI